eukprot:jgi/Botrbrau1/3191/Bobra.37_2s0021.1
MSGGRVIPQGYYNLNPGNVWVQPATTQGDGGDNLNNGGTMYIVGPNGCCALTLWTITNTKLLNSGQAPSFPNGKVIGTQRLLDPPGSSTMRNGRLSAVSGYDISMTAYINGKLYMMGTRGTDINGKRWAAPAWYILNADSGTVYKQGYIYKEGFDMHTGAVTANAQGNMAFVSIVTGPRSPGVASLRGSIDPNTGNVANLVYHVGNPANFPFNTNNDGNFRVGDYSAINYSDDGFVYGSTENSYSPGAGGIFDWGSSVWGRMTIA